jgi:uncharacterized protein DUF6152
MSIRVVLAVLISLAVGAGAVAHHSTAMFDDDNPATLTGTVQAFHWRNPHSMLVLDVATVTNAAGQSEPEKAGVWSVELHSTAIMGRRGYTKDYFMPGEQVTVNGGRMRDGSKMIRLLNGTKADGTPFFGDDFSPKATGHNQEAVN